MMKVKSKLLALLVVFTLALTALAACNSSGYSTVTFDLGGMACMSCERNVTQLIEGLGVTVVSVSARDDSLTVEFDPDSITQGAIEAALTEGGFEIRN